MYRGHALNPSRLKNPHQGGAAQEYLHAHSRWGWKSHALPEMRLRWGIGGGKSEPIPPNRWQQWMETQALFPVLLRPQAQVSTPGKGEGLRQLQGAEQDPGTLGSSLRTTLPSLFCCCCFIICALECKRLPPPPTFPSLSPIRSSATFVRWWRLLNAE